MQIVYVAPMKALAAEMTNYFSKRLEPLGITVKELTGDMQLSKGEILRTQVCLTSSQPALGVAADLFRGTTGLSFRLLGKGLVKQLNHRMMHTECIGLERTNQYCTSTASQTILWFCISHTSFGPVSHALPWRLPACQEPCLLQTDLGVQGR